MKERYDAAEVELKWQKIWNERQSFQSDLTKGEKFYVLEMFPYPSGHLHMGHVRNYAIGDVVARFQRMQGKQVVHPIGWDGFGLPAENAAIDRGVHPLKWTYENMDHMRTEFKRLGYSYEWDRELATCHPGYYKWEQALFIKMFEKGLAYRKTQLINFCPDCGTVLANEQVKEGRCERDGSQVEIREMPGWYFRITDYAQEMLEALDELEGKWDARVISQQRNWIGRSTGVEVTFPLTEPIAGHKSLDIFTTRPDTLYGVTFMSLAPEHPLALELARGTDREAEVEAFVQRVRAEDKTKRAAEDYEKEGVSTGRTCKNPLTGDDVPIFIANFVLMDYGTGAVMAVPAHDQRDFEFAKRYDVPIKVVIHPDEQTDLDPATMEAAYVEDGVQVQSGPFDGQPNRKAMEGIADLLESRGEGKRAVTYRLRDWSVARQRYWGCPIPIVYCDSCGEVAEKLENLPVLLPEDVEISGKGGSPLASHHSFPNTTCPKCGGQARRETDTFDTFVESSWYMHRFLCSRYEEDILDKGSQDQGMPIDQYIGGIEHATGHLMYTRFFHRVLRDLGYVSGNEPAARLLCQGMVCKETLFYKEGDVEKWVHDSDVDEDMTHKPTGKKVQRGRSEKMSKSKFNTEAPEVIINRFGADTARFFSLSDSPPEADLHWSDEGVDGAHRFLLRLWHTIYDLREKISGVEPYAGDGKDISEAARKLRQLTHASLERVTHDVDGRFGFNTAQARIRELYEGVRQGASNKDIPANVLAESTRILILTQSLFTPHVAEELWEAVGGDGIVAEASWPKADPKVAAPDTITIVVQVNGKLRARLDVDPAIDADVIKDQALRDDRVTPQLEGKEIKKVIYVPRRLVNIVAK